MKRKFESKTKITVFNLDQGKTHGQAVFKCIKAEQKVNLLKRKPGKVVVAARLQSSFAER